MGFVRRSSQCHASKIVLAAACLWLVAAPALWAATIVINPNDDSCTPADAGLESCAQACELDPAGCTEDLRSHINSTAFLDRAQLYPDTSDDDPNPTTPMHGLFNTILVNGIAHDALAAGINDPFAPLDLPPWSIVAKFNNNPGNETWETHMYKIPGYCPKRAVTSEGGGVCIGGDWFWFLHRGGLRVFDWDDVHGGEPSYGKAETFCLDCHAAVTEADWLWRVHFSRIKAQQNLRPTRVDGEVPGSTGAEFCDTVELSPVIPPDVRFDPATIDPPAKRQQMFNCFSWLSFVALNWPAKSDMRGVADTDVPFNTAPRDRVWETYKQVYETFQPLDPNWKLDNKEWNDPQPLPTVCQQALANAPEGSIDKNALSFQILNETHQAFGNQFNNLVDTNGNELRYNVRFNRTEWEYLKQKGYANTGRYDYDGPGFPIVFPDNQSPTAVDGLGATEFKSAWKELCTDPSSCNPVDDPDRYYSRYAFIYEPAIKKTMGVKPESCRIARMGLVGLHVIVKTFWTPQWIWYTFEHVDNVPRVGEQVDPNTNPNPYTLFNPQCLLDPPTPEECLGRTDPLICGQRPGIFGNEGRVLCCENLQMIFNSRPDPNNPPPACPAELGPDTSLISNQITRLDPIGQGPGDSIERTAALNQAFQEELAQANSPFQYYHLVNTQWPGGGRLGTNADPPYQIVQRLCLEGTPEPCFNFAPPGLRLRNTTMETFQVSYCTPDDQDISNNPGDCTPELVQQDPHQASSAGCMNCHFPSGNDSSFVWSDAIEELVPLEPNTLAGTVILATNGVDIGKATEVVSGNVIDNAVRGRIRIGKDAITPELFEIAGDQIRVKRGANVASDVAFNALSNQGTISGTQTTPLDLPVLTQLPPFVVGSPGSESILVERNGSLNLPPGSYGKLTVKRDAQLLLSGGEYSFISIDARKNAKLLFGGTSQVTVKNNIKVGNEVMVGPTATAIISPADIVFYVNGGKVKFGRDSMIQANFYAPNGKISFNRSDAQGAFIGAQVETGKDSEVILDSAFK